MCRMHPGHVYQCFNCGKKVKPPTFETVGEEMQWLYQRGWRFPPATGSIDFCSAFCEESRWPYRWWDYRR